MKTLIKDYIVEFVKEYENSGEIVSKYRVPLVGFADANHPDILNIREATFQEHQMPKDILKDPTIIIAYFIPFKEEIARSNEEGKEASKQWLVTYQETNEMFIKLNKYMIEKIEDMGYKAAVSEEAPKFDTNVLKSKWSHRHIARIAGLGTFGMNNMLITEEGCCGRYYTIVTNLPVEADKLIDDEYCLYKKNKSCGVCVKHCFSKALSLEGYNRFKCYDTCMTTFDKYEGLYGDKEWKIGNPKGGSEVCGKCVVNLPCSFKRP